MRLNNQRLSNSEPPTPQGRTQVRESISRTEKSRDDAECFVSQSSHPSNDNEASFLHRKNPVRSRNVVCSRCDKDAIIWCSECSSHLCETHDRQRHNQSMFSKYHKRGYSLNVNRERNEDQATGPNYNSVQNETCTNSNCLTLEIDEHSAQVVRSECSKESSKKREKQNSSPIMFKRIRKGYENLVMAIIRPPRFSYTVNDLRPQALSIGGGLIMNRMDFEVKNRFNLNLKCSFWKPSYVNNSSQLPCVVYLHGNSSSRTDVVRTRALSSLGSISCTVLAFDFSGSGQSEGEFVTLGGNELHDVHYVLTSAVEKKLATRFTLWGRSMGAASALLYSSYYGTERLSGLVLDSPFASFRGLCVDLVKMGAFRIPKLAVRAALNFIRRSVKHRTNTDIRKLKPLNGVHKIDCPALFICAKDDNVVPPHHSERLSKKYRGPCYVVKCSGRHNTMRPLVVQDSITFFIRASFRWPSQPIESTLESIKRHVEQEESFQFENNQSALNIPKPIPKTQRQHRMSLKSSAANRIKPPAPPQRQPSNKNTDELPLQSNPKPQRSSSHFRSRKLSSSSQHRYSKSRSSFLDDYGDDEEAEQLQVERNRKSTYDYELYARNEKMSGSWEAAGYPKDMDRNSDDIIYLSHSHSTE